MMLLTMQMPESAFAAMHQTPNKFSWEIRAVAAVKWFELGRIPQGRAAEIAGLTHATFNDAPSRYRVGPFRFTAEDSGGKQ